MSSKLLELGFYRRMSKMLCLTFIIGLCWSATTNVAVAQGQPQGTQTAADAGTETLAVDAEVGESDLKNYSIFTRALQGGWVVFLCLLLLVSMSVLTWGICIAKWFYLTRMTMTSDTFIKSFWDSRSLNDLNSRLQEYPYSPAREVFRSGYAELVRGSQLRDQASTADMAVGAAMDNLQRALNKSKMYERRRMEKYVSILAISASAAPFIGLFGTVWGIMGAFEGIAQTGSASLAAVAPGISEALIATAFGLAAAIPAVVGYNIFAGRIRGQMGAIDGFVSDFLNIVERYLVTDRNAKTATTQGGSAPL